MPAPEPQVAAAVDREAIRVGVARGVEPRHRHALAEVRAREQARDGLVVGGRVGVGFFQAMGDLIDAVKGSNRGAIQRGLSEIDTLQQGLSDAIAQVGTDLNVVDSQNNVLDEITLRLKSTMSDIQDLDYTEAITKMNKDQLALEAAQSSFAKISKLSLFNYIN